MSPYTIYTGLGCGYCTRAKQLLQARGLPYTELQAMDHQEDMDRRVVAATGKRPTTIPQIFQGSRYVGGYTQLAAELQATEGEA